LLHFIPTPIGNLEDISIRSLSLLSEATTVFCEDTRVAKRLIYLLEEKHQISFKPKNYISMHSHNEKRVLESLDLSIFDENVVYMSDAGMPCVSDPGCELVKYLQKHGLEYEVVPGANAALLAYAASGFCHKEFLFFGFLPHKGKDREQKLQEVLNSSYVSILYESPHRIYKLIEELAKFAPQREIFIIKEATKMHEFKLRATAKEIASKFDTINQKGEWVVVIDAQKSEGSQITLEDITSLKLPKKEASKLIAKLTGKSPKECYSQLIEDEGKK